jgi:very-short-patch-repair endonuclease
MSNFKLNWHGKELIAEIEDICEDAVNAGAEKIARDARRLVPVNTGGLKKSICVKKFKKPGVFGAYVKAGEKGKEHIACILGGNKHRVKTDKGFVPISIIKSGDYVISQDGLKHKVTHTNKFLATKKPDMVEIRVEHQKSRKHILTTTIDHKILTFKKGVSFWIKAGDLKAGDFVFTPIKKAHNKGTASFKICVNCGIRYHKTMGLGQGKKYCSPECRDEHWNKGSNPHIGMKRSKETCLKISKKANEFLANNPDMHINKRMAKKGFQTNTEKEVERWLLKIGLPYEKQFRVGRNYVDFAIPFVGILIEADGAYWHKKQGVDIERDKKILKKMPSATIIHIHFADKRFTPKIEYNPMPNVYYIQCNSSMNSFVNLDYFKLSKIELIKHFRYEKPAATGSCKKLYDLSIDGVHSFIVSGIVVSNSFVELGTPGETYRIKSKRGQSRTPIKASPYMRPALKKNKRKFKNDFQNKLK